MTINNTQQTVLSYTKRLFIKVYDLDVINVITKQNIQALTKVSDKNVISVAITIAQQTDLCYTKMLFMMAHDINMGHVITKLNIVVI